jgi:hypothetical protein
MSAISYSSLLANRPPLPQVPVKIEGLDSELLIHTFTVADYSKVIDVAGMNDEQGLRVQILRFLGGLNADVSPEAVEDLAKVFTPWQMRDVYLKALRLNGQGPSALGDAEKK